MHLVFAVHTGKASLASACRRLMDAAEANGFSCSLLHEGELPASEDETAIVAVGGDGNFIRTAQIACRNHIPLFGVNCGRIGFLTEWTEETFPEALQMLKEGAYAIHERAMLAVSVNGEHLRDCFNDLLIYKHSFSGVMKISLEINGQSTGDLFGDGLIVATSTGATGYSLSAGGPIVADGLETMVVTPICAHTLHFRPVVCSMGSTVEVVMDGKGVLAADGDRFRAVSRNDRITVTRSSQVTKLMTFRDRNLFRLISEKLN
ncbi:MAG: NAD(+)/NADH kinase [Clostridia bacterium]|nr:NAD(+)/NADH kinase [Clostridia bacterium]